MEFVKLILLSCTLLVACSKGDETTTVTENPDQDQLESTTNTVPDSSTQNYGFFRRHNKITNNLRQCFCFLQKPTGVPVIQRLNPNREKLERLVIYVYKDESPDGYKMYLPNYEKQLMIPDLALDQGDILESWPSEEIESIFNKYPDRTTNRDQAVVPDIAQIIDPEDLNVPTSFYEDNDLVDVKQTLIPNNNNLISTSGQTLNPNAFNPITPYEDQVKEDSNLNDYDFSDKTKVEPDPQLVTDYIKYNTEKPYPDQGFDTSEDPNAIPEDTDLQDKAMKIVQINQNFDLNPQPGDKNKITKDTIGFPNSDNNFNININLDLSNGDEENEQPSKIDVAPQPNEHHLNVVPQREVVNPEPVIHGGHFVNWPEPPNQNIVSVPTNPLIWNTAKTQYIPKRTNIKKITNYVPERKMIKTIPTKSPNIWKQNIYDPRQRKIVTLHPHRLVQKYPQKKPIDEHNINVETFDNWLIHQLERVQFAESEAANSIDIYTLKYLIEKTLRKSGYFIATNGLLVDSNGVQIHMANLVLRPILIGNSVEYKNLLKGMVGTFKLPTDLPYLEAVLITSIKPQKILGIVPLGKTYLPKDYRNPLSLYVQDSQHSGCNKCNGNGVQGGQYFQTGPVEEIYHQNPSRWIKTNNRPYVKKKRYGVKNFGQTPRPFALQRDGLVQGSRRVFPFNQITSIIDNLYKMDRPYLVDYNIQPVVTKETIHGVPSAKYPGGGVTPGFRIIGGNAATSSGTPVSSKGRSGIEPGEVKTADEE